MEGDAKGQLGGLDCSVQERERLAGLSREWKCAVCERSNGEVLEESERAWREKEGEGKEVDRGEVEIPEELRFRDKEELQEKSVENSKAQSSKETGTDEEAELAEGFVKTGNPARMEARPGQSVPLPTGTTSSSVTRRVNQPQAQPQAAQITAAPSLAQAQAQIYREPTVAQVLSNEGVPAWIDRSIAVVVACLVAVVLKVLLGL